MPEMRLPDYVRDVFAQAVDGCYGKIPDLIEVPGLVTAQFVQSGPFAVYMHLKKPDWRTATEICVWVRGSPEHFGAHNSGAYEQLRRRFGNSRVRHSLVGPRAAGAACG